MQNLHAQSLVQNVETLSEVTGERTRGSPGVLDELLIVIDLHHDVCQL